MISEIKQRYPLRETVERVIGDRLKASNSHVDIYLCPFHDDVLNPSFTVYDDRCSCRAGCLINGREWADVLDFIQEYYNIPSVKEAASHLVGQLPDPPQRKYRKKAPAAPSLTMRDVEEGVKYQQQAMGFFLSRGLKERTVTAHQLGMYPAYGNKLVIDGEEHWFRAPRFTVPNIAYGKVRKIELRLDTESARQNLRLIDSQILKRVIQEFKREPTEDDLVYTFFGGRYTNKPGGIKRNLIFNVERVIKRIEHEGKMGWFSPDMPYVLLHEGAFKAMAMEDACDDPEWVYPSIAGHAPEGLSNLVGVKELIIVQDRDEDKVKPDGTLHNAGAEYARRALEVSGRKLGVNARIIMPPEGFKDADEVVRAGQAHQWMDSLGIEPLRTRHG